MRLLTSLPLVAIALAGLFEVSGCASSRTKALDKPLLPPMEEEAVRASIDSHLGDVKTAAAQQLECPIEQVNVVCLRRDTEGECVYVQADGCDKRFEYQFGDG